MIKANVLQAALIIVAIIIGFLAIQQILSYAVYSIFQAIDSYRNDESIFFSIILILLTPVIQLILSWILIKKSTAITQTIITRSNISGTFSFVTNASDLLFVALVAIGIYLLVTVLPSFLTDFLNGFRRKGGNNINNLMYTEKPVNWTLTFLTILTPLLLLMFARPIANYFAKNIQEDNTISVEDSIGANEE